MLCKDTNSLPVTNNNQPLPSVDRERRSVLQVFLRFVVGLGFATLGSVLGLWTAATGRFMFPNVVNERPRQFKAGYLRDYPPGAVETRFADRYGVWIVNSTYRGHAQTFALRTSCTHLGCIAVWQVNEGRFKCPCHGSAFRVDGINIDGPAPRPLERCAIRLADDGQLEVDTSRTYREELGQWMDPESYTSEG